MKCSINCKRKQLDYFAEKQKAKTIKSYSADNRKKKKKKLIFDEN